MTFIDGVKGLFGGGRQVAATGVNEAASIVAGRSPNSALATSVGAPVTRSGDDLATKLAERKQIHMIKNLLIEKAKEASKLGSMLENVAQRDGLAAVASHQGRYDRLEYQLAELLHRHDALVASTGQKLDGQVRAAVEMITAQRDPAKIASMVMPSGASVLEARIHQLLGEAVPFRRPVLDVSEAAGPRSSSLPSVADTPQASVDRYRQFVGDPPAEGGRVVPNLSDAPSSDITLPSVAGSARPRTLPDASGPGRSIGLPKVEREPPRAPTTIGRSNSATDFLNRDLTKAVPADEMTDADMKRKLDALKADPSLGGGFKGVTFDIGDDNNGRVRIEI